MAGRLPSELMPPIESELAASDFDDAVVLHLHLFERQRALNEMQTHALMIAEALGARLGSPGRGRVSILRPGSGRVLRTWFSRFG